MKTTKARKRKRAAAVVLKRLVSNPEPITEAEIVRALPQNINTGGALEMKRGKLCLRNGDEIEMLSARRWRITREWMPPGRAPWDRKLYAIANELRGGQSGSMNRIESHGVSAGSEACMTTGRVRTLARFGASTRPVPRYPGRTYVMMREGDPWHACEVTILKRTRAFKINGVEYFDCYLPKRWRKIATAKQEETRAVRRSELW